MDKKQQVYVDHATYADDIIKGYHNGEHVVTLYGVKDISLLELFDETGNRVIPVKSE